MNTSTGASDSTAEQLKQQQQPTDGQKSSNNNSTKDRKLCIKSNL